MVSGRTKEGQEKRKTCSTFKLGNKRLFGFVWAYKAKTKGVLWSVVESNCLYSNNVLKYKFEVLVLNLSIFFYATLYFCFPTISWETSSLLLHFIYLIPLSNSCSFT